LPVDGRALSATEVLDVLFRPEAADSAGLRLDDPDVLGLLAFSRIMSAVRYCRSAEARRGRRQASAPRAGSGTPFRFRRT